ncbi:hypothetical protein [Neorhizobium sp. P12A]|uniref:hypothetical protein n=1 Tax=Neorhizobium sp. P12A TaxID=2268027 RepID=UPI00165DD139|nr:hypothetical protein [Neorhizobium sp. P12A]
MAKYLAASEDIGPVETAAPSIEPLFRRRRFLTVFWTMISIVWVVAVAGLIASSMLS